MPNLRDRAGMATFLLIWAGQLVSSTGSKLTHYALAFFVFRETGSATQLSFIILASQLPHMVMAPLAGVFVDRWDRRRVLIASDAAAGLATLVIALLLITDRLEVWHLYVALGVSGLGQAFQGPAYEAAITLLVAPVHYTRAAGLVLLAEAIGRVLGPALAAYLLVRVGLGGVVLIDVGTFVVAVATLLVVRVPRPEPAGSARSLGSLWSETRFGLTYLYQRSGLLTLLIYFSLVNLMLSYVGVLAYPLVLGFADEQATGMVFSIGAVGMISGGVCMTVWGGPRRKLRGVIGGCALLSVGVMSIGVRPWLPLVAAGGFVGFFALSVASASSQAIWQSRVEPHCQGRVFAIRRLFTQLAEPMGVLSAGPLLDGVFEPMLSRDGALAGSVGAIIGTGPGRGAACMFVLLGMLGLLASAVVYARPAVRRVEDGEPTPR